VSGCLSLSRIAAVFVVEPWASTGFPFLAADVAELCSAMTSPNSVSVF
jgi:hypothetical protein